MNYELKEAWRVQRAMNERLMSEHFTQQQKEQAFEELLKLKDIAIQVPYPDHYPNPLHFLKGTGIELMEQFPEDE